MAGLFDDDVMQAAILDAGSYLGGGRGGLLGATLQNQQRMKLAQVEILEKKRQEELERQRMEAIGKSMMMPESREEMGGFTGPPQTFPERAPSNWQEFAKRGMATAASGLFDADQFNTLFAKLMDTTGPMNVSAGAGAIMPLTGETLAERAPSNIQELEVLRSRPDLLAMDLARRQAGATNIGGIKPPSGYMMDPARPGAVTPIPGSPGDVKQKMEVNKYVEIGNAIDNYEKLLNELGTEVVPGENKAKLASAYQTMTVGLKELFELGALSGGDLDLMKGVANDPTAWDAMFRDDKEYSAPLNALRGMIQRKVAAASGKAPPTEDAEAKRAAVRAKAAAMGIQ